MFGFFKKPTHRFTIKTVLAPLEFEVTIDPKKLEEIVLREILAKEKEVIKELRHDYHPPEVIGENIATMVIEAARKSVRLTVKLN